MPSKSAPLTKEEISKRKIPYKKPDKKIKLSRNHWSKEKETEDCDVVLSAYSNNLAKPMFVARDPDVKYFRYLSPQEFIDMKLNKRKFSDFPVYTYGHNAKRYLDIFLSGNVKNLGKEYFGYNIDLEDVDSNSPYSSDRQFVCWKDDVFNGFEKWLVYCDKVCKYE